MQSRRRGAALTSRSDYSHHGRDAAVEAICFSGVPHPNASVYTVVFSGRVDHYINDMWQRRGKTGAILELSYAD